MCYIITQEPEQSFSSVDGLFVLTCGIFRYIGFYFSTLACFYEKSTVSSLVFAASAVIEYPMQIAIFKKVPTLNSIVGSAFIIPCVVAAVLLKSQEEFDYY